MSPPQSALVVAPVRSDADVQCACDIMVEAADWLVALGQPLWSRKSLTLEFIRPLPAKGTLFLAHLDCALRPKLFALYESAGFRRHSEWTINGFTVRRYQRSTGQVS